MANDRNAARLPWLRRTLRIRWLWLIRPVALGLVVALFLVSESASSPAQLATQVVLTAFVLLEGIAQAVGAMRGVWAYDWNRWGRFAWLRYLVIAAAILVFSSLMFMLLVAINPVLRPMPMTSVAAAVLVAVIFLIMGLLALLLLVVALLILWLPVAIVRSRRRERRRRHYRYPAQ